MSKHACASLSMRPRLIETLSSPSPPPLEERTPLNLSPNPVISWPNSTAETQTPKIMLIHRIRSSLDGAVLQGTSPAVAQLRQIVRKVPRTEATVLIQVKPGTG